MTYVPKLCVEDAGDIDIGIPGCSVQHVKQFKYLGSIVSDDLSLDLDITEELHKQESALEHSKTLSFSLPHVTSETKNVLFQSTVLSVSTVWVIFLGRD